MRKRKQQEAIKSVSLFVSMVSAKVFLFFVLSLFRLISQTIMDDDGDVMGGMMFDDEDFYEKPPEGSVKLYRFRRSSHQCQVRGESKIEEQTGGEKQDQSTLLKLQLVGSHPLWGHCLWNAGIVITDMISGQPLSILQKTGDHSQLVPHLSKIQRPCGSCATYLDVSGKRVLELGAASALPSLVSALCGAKSTVISDYPDTELLENIRKNVENCLPSSLQNRVAVCGYIWGKDPSELLSTCLGDVGDVGDGPPPSSSSLSPRSSPFDVILLADLVFNHSEHSALLTTCQNCLSPSGEVIVAFSHHIPENEEKDLRFLTLAVNPPFNFKIELLFRTKKPVMFEEDSGDVDVRSTVHIYRLYR